MHVCLCLSVWMYVIKFENSLKEMRSLNCSKQPMRKSKESEIVFLSPTFSRAKSAADSSNATNFLNKNRVSILNIFEDIFPLKCNRKPTKWKFHLFNEISSISLARVKFISFLRFSFAFEQVRNIYPQDYFSFASFVYFSFHLAWNLSSRKKVFEDFAWIFRIFSLVLLVIWRDTKKIVEMRRDQKFASKLPNEKFSMFRIFHPWKHVLSYISAQNETRLKIGEKPPTIKSQIKCELFQWF